MGHIKQRTKFPCGLEIEYEMKLWFAEPKMEGTFTEKGCPLHGLKCKAIEKK